MRILQIITLSELGGGQSVVANIANSFSEEHEVVVVAGEGDGKMRELLDERVAWVHLPRLKRSLSLFDDLCTIYDFWKLYIKYKPDIIHLHSSKAGMLGRVAFPARKVVYTVHGFDSIRLAHRQFLCLEKLMQRRCKSIVAVSKYDERNLIAEKIERNIATVYNGTPTFEVGDNLSFDIPEKYITASLLGKEISFHADGVKDDIVAKVYAIDPQADSETHTIRIRARYQNTANVVSGMFVKGELITEENRAYIMIPTEAVVPEMEGKRLWVVRNGKAVSTPVETESRDARYVEVVSGIQVGDTVLTGGLMQLRDGMKVKVTIK